MVPRQMSPLCIRRLTAAEMFVDVGQSDGGTITNWVAESGVLDLFFMLGPKPAQASLHLT